MREQIRKEGRWWPSSSYGSLLAVKIANLQQRIAAIMERLPPEARRPRWEDHRSAEDAARRTA